MTRFMSFGALALVAGTLIVVQTVLLGFIADIAASVMLIGVGFLAGFLSKGSIK